MTDLSHIFSPLRPSSSPLQPWSIQQLDNSLRQISRTNNNPNNFIYQLDKFRFAQQKELIAVTMFFFISLELTCFALNLDRRITFHLWLLFSTELVSFSAFELCQNPLLRNSCKCINPLVHAATCYYLLKVLAGSDLSSPNGPATILSVTATLFKVTVDYLQPILRLQTEQLLYMQINKRSFLSKLSFFPLLVWEKCILLLKVIYLLALIFSFGVIASLCLSSEALLWQFAMGLKRVVIVAVGLDIFFELLKFLSIVVREQVKGLHNKMPIVLNLLQLSPKNSFTQLVHRKCLESLYCQMLRTHCFLSTETCKSLLFNTYMDLFNSFAVRELEQLNQSLSADLRIFQHSKNTFYLPKTTKQDLFIQARRANAQIRQLRCAHQILSKLQAVTALIRVILLADKQSQQHQDPIRPSRRITELLIMIEGKVGRVLDLSVWDSVFKGELQAYLRQLEGRLFSLGGGWTEKEAK